MRNKPQIITYVMLGEIQERFLKTMKKQKTIWASQLIHSGWLAVGLFDFTAFWFLTVWFHCVLAWDCLISLRFGLGLFDFTVFWSGIVWFHCALVWDCLISLCSGFGLFDFTVFWFWIVWFQCVLVLDCLISLCSGFNQHILSGLATGWLAGWLHFFVVVFRNLFRIHPKHYIRNDFCIVLNFEIHFVMILNAFIA